MHLVVGGGRFATLGLRLGHFVAVDFSRRVVGTSFSRLVIGVPSKPCLCCCCASFRVHYSSYHWTRNPSHKEGSFIVVDTAWGAHFQHDIDACVIFISIATSEEFSGNLCFPFQVGFSLVIPSLSWRWDVENDFGREAGLIMSGLGFDD